MHHCFNLKHFGVKEWLLRDFDFALNQRCYSYFTKRERPHHVASLGRPSPLLAKMTTLFTSEHTLSG